jgi:hypothetical protein
MSLQSTLPLETTSSPKEGRKGARLHGNNTKELSPGPLNFEVNEVENNGFAHEP